MTAEVFGEDESGQAVDPYSPDHVAPLVAYLASPAADADHRPGLRGVRRDGGAASPRRSSSSASTPPATSGTSPTSTSSSARYFADRDPSVGFAADSVMQLAASEEDSA